MKLDSVLIADDEKKNGLAAKISFPMATIANSAKEAIKYLSKNRYDLVISDLHMETDTAGYDVVKAALRAGSVSYIASSGVGGYHGSHPLAGKGTVRVRPYIGDIGGFDGKSEPEFWGHLRSRIENATGSHKAYQLAVKMTGGVLLEDTYFETIYNPKFGGRK